MTFVEISKNEKCLSISFNSEKFVHKCYNFCYLLCSPAKSKSTEAAEKDLAALRSSLAARKAAQNPARLSLIATPLDKTKNENNEALSRSQPDLFIGIDQSGLQSPPGIVEAIDKNNKNINPLYANTSELTLNPHPSNIPPLILPKMGQKFNIFLKISEKVPWEANGREFYF